MFRTLLHHPRKIRLRRALFQIHLWVGVLLSVYIAVIGLSGSVIVFEEEYRHAALRGYQYDPAQVAPLADVLERARAAALPGESVYYVMAPSKAVPVYSIYLHGGTRGRRMLMAEATSGALAAEQRRTFMDWMKDLHVYLLMGERGFIINCIAGMGLLVLALTGAVLWWPGVRLWMRGFVISLRHGWKRINLNTHYAVGIWTLFIVSWWGMTAIYFLLPAKTAAVVNRISRIEGMRAPVAVPDAGFNSLADVGAMLREAQRLVPQGTLSGVGLPEVAGKPVTVYVDTGRPGDFSHRDINTFDGHTGRLLTVWHYGVNRTAGDWFLWLMQPLHFGTAWGLAVKIVWALLGLSLPVLSVTGLVMYWNRYLGKRWAVVRAVRR
ncbi:MAG TPA: PepSY-associated TM helix domain-containing protein [Acidobacteriaceae bacterium]